MSRGVTKSLKTSTEESREPPDNVTVHRLTLQAMYFKTDGCPIEATADMHFCAAQGRDHTEVRLKMMLWSSFIASLQSLASSDVLYLSTTSTWKSHSFIHCLLHRFRITKLDYSYVPCYDRFEQMKLCFYNEIHEKANRQFGSR
ncbi:DB module [Necator americanus]|uniref:DB module n=1 Tax=Necator americanus TaxID=51031 RepID=W2TG81_NECAM|nr:DB module [Necator americanus]ETN80818.1 DB module [Necator americanus]